MTKRITVLDVQRMREQTHFRFGQRHVRPFEIDSQGWIQDVFHCFLPTRRAELVDYWGRGFLHKLAPGYQRTAVHLQQSRALGLGAEGGLNDGHGAFL